MKNVAKLIVVLVAVAALLAVPAVSALAQATVFGEKPVAVVAISPTDELVADAKYLVEAAGAGEVGGMITMLSAPFTAGLDGDKPIGAAVAIVDGEPKVLGFIPIKDFDAVLAALRTTVGEAKDAGDGVKELDGPQPVFVTEKGGWAFVAAAKEDLSDLPADPTALLDGLDEDYDVAIRANLQNIPEPLRQMAIGQMKAGMAGEMEQMPEEDDAQYELRKKLTKNQMAQMERLFDEAEQITIGWNIDSAAKATYIDMVVSAVKGSKLARQLSAYGDAKSNFAGFAIPGAAVTANFTGKMDETEIEEAVTLLDAMRATALAELEDSEDLPDDEARDAAKQMVDNLMDVAVNTVKSGTMDGGAVVLLGEKSITVAMGGYVADGAKLQAAFEELIKLAEKEDDFPGVEMNADAHKGVKFHTMSVPVPEEEDARDVLGDTLDVAVGIGENSAYMAFGTDCVSQLKQIIDASAAAGATDVDPVKIVVSLTPILKFAAAVEENPALDIAVEVLEAADGADKVSITGSTEGRTITYRIQVEEGVLKAIGKAGQAAAGGLGGGGLEEF